MSRPTETHSVYRITNTKTGRSYVGATRSEHGRLLQHRAAVSSGSGSNELYQDISDNGKWDDVVTWEVLSTHTDIKEASDAEVVAIAKEENPYNRNKGGDYAGRAKATINLLGSVQTEEVIENLRQKHMGRKHSAETRARQSASLTGHSRKAQPIIAIKFNDAGDVEDIIVTESQNAMARALGVSPGMVSHVLQGRQQTTRGYMLYRAPNVK